MKLAGTRGSGKLQKGLTVRTNDSQRPQIALMANAEIASALQIEPAMISFGQIDRSSTEPVSKSVKIRRGSGGPIKPSVDAMASPSLHAELKEVTPGEEYDLTVTAGPPWPNGPLNTAISVNTGVERSPNEGIPVVIQVQPRLAAEPMYLMVDEKKCATEAQDMTVDLVWRGGPPGKIESAVASRDDIAVEVGPSAERQTVTIKLPVGFKLDRTKAQRVMIKTDDPAAPLLGISLVSAPSNTASPIQQKKLRN